MKRNFRIDFWVLGILFILLLSGCKWEHYTYPAQKERYLAKKKAKESKNSVVVVTPPPKPDDLSLKKTKETEQREEIRKENREDMAAATKVIRRAEEYMGAPYRVGGLTPSGVDCSGLSLSAFEKVNISLPRTSAGQSAVGKPVSKDSLQPGDLVFFKNPAKKNSAAITHVGIVVEVRGKEDVIFIHASTTRGVVKDNLYDRHWVEAYVKARRVL